MISILNELVFQMPGASRIRLTSTIPPLRRVADYSVAKIHLLRQRRGKPRQPFLIEIDQDNSAHRVQDFLLIRLGFVCGVWTKSELLQAPLSALVVEQEGIRHHPEKISQ